MYCPAAAQFPRRNKNRQHKCTWTICQQELLLNKLCKTKYVSKLSKQEKILRLGIVKTTTFFMRLLNAMSILYSQ